MPAHRTRQRLLEAAAGMHAAGDPVTVTGAARRAGVSRATASRHFASRSELRAGAGAPDVDSRGRLLEAALVELSATSLSRLSLEAVAERAGVSRATAYRLFPGRPALFRELVATYSPLETISATLAGLAGRPAAVVMPALARAAGRHLAGREGLVRTLLFEVAGDSPEAGAAREFAFAGALGAVASFLAGEMAAGRVRAAHPLLALQAFAGPLMLHIVTRRLVAGRLGFEPPLEEVAAEFAGAWVRAWCVA